MRNTYFTTSLLKKSEKLPFFNLLQGFERKKDLAEHYTLQGRFYNLLCPLCYKAICLFTKSLLFAGVFDIRLCRYSRFKVRRKSLQNTTFQEKNTTSIFLHHAFPPSIIGSPVSVCLRTISADEMYFLFQSFSTNSFES